MYDLVIVGGGPAGLTAAIYAIRKRLNVLLISEDLGGKTNYQMMLPWMESYQVIRGVDIVEKFRRELTYLDFTHRMEHVQKLSKENDVFTLTLNSGETITAKSVIVATGSQVRHLNVPGEREYTGRGLSYSAISYAPLFLGKHTTVVGDGMLALRATAELAKVADAVCLVAPSHGMLDTPLAKSITGSDVKVVVLEGHTVKRVMGNGFVDRVVLATPEGGEAEIGTDGVFVELGLLPNSQLVDGVAVLDAQGRIMIDTRNHTNVRGLFAAGDVTNAYAEQVLIAIGEGAKAALSAYEYLLAN